MSSLRPIYHLVRADFLERVRRYSFLGTLGFAVYLGFLCVKGDITVKLGEWRGHYNSAWLGMMMTLVSTTFLSLAGFYIVSNSVKRDEKTRVGQILAATPMSRVSYAFAKAISNFAVLSSMVAVLAFTAVLFQLFRGEDRHLDVVALLSPFIVFALPLMALVACLAVFFETTPILRSGAGTIIYFFLWTSGIVACEKLRYIDLLGIGIYMRELEAAVRKFDPAYKDGFVLGLDFGQAQGSKLFPWNGMHFPAEILLGRLFWIVIAIALTALSSIWFHRFDPVRMRLNRGTRQPKMRVFNESEIAEVVSAAHLTPLPHTRSKAWFWPMFLGEMRMLVLRHHWAVYIASAGLIIAGCFSPLDAARRGVLAAAWIFPAFALSRMGAREDLFSTRTLVFAGPSAASRQLVSSWLAGATLPFALSAGVAVRLLVRFDIRGVLALIAGSLFVSAAALVLGNLTRTPKTFEAIYVSWWYAGPLNQIPGCDFFGATAASARPLQYAVFAAILICSAWTIRRARMAAA